MTLTQLKSSVGAGVGCPVGALFVGGSVGEGAGAGADPSPRQVTLDTSVAISCCEILLQEL